MIATAAYIIGAAMGAWPLDIGPLLLCAVADWVWADLTGA